MKSAMKSAGELLAGVAANTLAPRAAIGVAEWADKYRQVVVGERKGRWESSITPYLYGPMAAYVDPGVRQITIMAPRQVAKTEFLYNCLFWSIDQQPRDTLLVYPTDKTARFNNRRRFIPTLKATPKVRARVSKAKRDVAVGEIAFDRMVLRWVGSNSESELESFPYAQAMIDELDRCAPDTLPQVRESLKTFAESKLVVSSSPSLVGQGIDAEYNGTQVSFSDEDDSAQSGQVPSDRRKYFVPCCECGSFYLRAFSLVRWNGGKSASPAIVRNTAWMECPHCNKPNTVADNQWQLSSGIWLPKGATITPLILDRDEDGLHAVGGGEVTVPDDVRTDHVGFAIHGLCSGLQPNPYGAVAEKFLRNGGIATRSWVTRTVGEAWAIKGESVEVRDLAAAAGGYEIGQVVPGVLAITMGVDVQQDRMYVEVLGWGERGRECWLIDYHEIARVRGGNLAELDAVVSRQYVRQDGRKMGVNVVGVDSGRYTDEVYRWVQRWQETISRGGTGPRKVWAVKGEQGTTSTMPWRVSEVKAREDRAASKVGEGLKLLIVNTGFWKEYALARLAAAAGAKVEAEQQQAMAEGAVEGGDDAEGGASDLPGVAGRDRWRFPAGVSRSYLMQLTAEQLVRERRGARVVSAWVLRPGRNANHYGDCRVYGCAIADCEGVSRLRAQPAAAANGGGSRPAAAPRGPGVAQRGSSLMQRARERAGY